MNEENPVRAERSGSPKRYLNLVHLKLPVHELKLSRELAVYIGRGVSIYWMCNIYMSNVLYLYIQWYPYRVFFAMFSLKADKDGILKMEKQSETRNLTIFLNK